MIVWAKIVESINFIITLYIYSNTVEPPIVDRHLFLALIFVLYLVLAHTRTDTRM